MREIENRLLTEPEGIAILSRHGLPYPEHGFARCMEDAAGIAEGIGYPVVLKVVSPDIAHKSDVGGVITGIRDKAALSRAYPELLDRVARSNPAARIEGVLVCAQAEPGLELVAGGIVDDIFGPVVMFGIGGIYVEAYRDVSFRVCPLSQRDAMEMVRGIRGYDVVKGMRGQGNRDIGMIADLMMRVSGIMEAGGIREVDLNPVRAYDDRILVLDARIVAEGV